MAFNVELRNANHKLLPETMSLPAIYQHSTDKFDLKFSKWLQIIITSKWEYSCMKSKILWIRQSKCWFRHFQVDSNAHDAIVQLWIPTLPYFFTVTNVPLNSLEMHFICQKHGERKQNDWHTTNTKWKHSWRNHSERLLSCDKTCRFVRMQMSSELAEMYFSSIRPERGHFIKRNKKWINTATTMPTRIV